MSPSELGVWGEQRAVEFLVKNGFEILERNYRYKRNEVDIIAQKNGILHIVEVKTRESNYLGEPFEAVTKNKQKQIIQVANHYVIEKDLELEVQFDILSIIHNQKHTNIEQIEDAFFPLV